MILQVCQEDSHDFLTHTVHTPENYKCIPKITSLSRSSLFQTTTCLLFISNLWRVISFFSPNFFYLESIQTEKYGENRFSTKRTPPTKMDNFEIMNRIIPLPKGLSISIAVSGCKFYWFQETKKNYPPWN